MPGVGDARADWLFVGEAPGADEDARGEPFVGQAGRLLDSMLAALGMNRAKAVYIANVLKCRPPGNRAPEPLEVDACLPYLDRQIALIQPKLIVALGKSAATSLLRADATIASLRGRVHRYRGVPLIVTYHPAYLLRTLPDKAKAWEDLCLARATLRGILRRGRLVSRRTGPICHAAGYFVRWRCLPRGENIMRKLFRPLAAVLAARSWLFLSRAAATTTCSARTSRSRPPGPRCINQYQRRADLVPNLVNTVKGYAAQEQTIFIQVAEARANVGAIKVTPELINDPAAFAKFQAAQGQLQWALSRLLVVSENYPQLKSDAVFRDLTAQLEGTENRITVARNRYIKAVQDYNVTVRTFPTNLTAMLFKMDVKPNFTVDNEKAISVPPTVDFGKAPAPP